jgi:hypothetical protein
MTVRLCLKKKGCTKKVRISASKQDKNLRNSEPKKLRT